jgi:hypothetical protein
MDLANLRFRRQPKITQEEAMMERDCEHFCENDEDKTHLFELAEEMGLE